MPNATPPPTAAGFNISPMTLRKVVGYLGLALPIVVKLGASMTMFQFTKTGGAAMTPRKRSRNKVYIGCGLAMIGAFAAVAYLKHQSPSASIFWPETVAIVAFALAWLTKGQAILKDKQATAAGRQCQRVAGVSGFSITGPRRAYQR